MKKTFTLLLFVLLSIFLNAQTANIIFVNNQSSTNFASIDVEIVQMPGGTILQTITGIDFQTASTVISVPASTLLTVNYYKTGTSTLLKTNTNQVYDPGSFHVEFVYGTTGISWCSGTAYVNSSSSNKIEFDFRHQSKTIDEVNLMVRETSVTLAENFTFGSSTFTFDDEIDAGDYILDMLDANTGNGLYAYIFPGLSVAGDYIVLFSSDTDLFMLEMDGTVTKLQKTTPFVVDDPSSLNDLNSDSNIKVVNGILTINSSLSNTIESLSVYGLTGTKLLSGNLSSLDVSSLNSGVYLIKAVINGNIEVEKMVISK